MACFYLKFADCGQTEPRIAGLLSADPVIRTAYEQNQDLHWEIVARVTGRHASAISDKEPKLVNALNFGLWYGAGAATFRKGAQVDYGIEITASEAHRFKQSFDQTYAHLRQRQRELHLAR